MGRGRPEKGSKIFAIFFAGGLFPGFRQPIGSPGMQKGRLEAALR